MINKGAIFAVGLFVGSIVGYLVGKEYAKEYEQRRADQEIAEMREHWKNKRKEEKETKETKKEIADEEFEAMREEYATVRHQELKTLDEYKDIIAANGYAEKAEEFTDPRDAKVLADHLERVAAKRKEEKEKMKKPAPYVIDPDQFDDGTFENVETLILFEDGVLTDEFDNPVMDIYNTVGDDYMGHFGEHPDDPDATYIRNEAWSTDYEILRDTRNYYDVYPEDRR